MPYFSDLYLKSYTYTSKIDLVLAENFMIYISNMLAILYGIKDYTIKITY